MVNLTLTKFLRSNILIYLFVRDRVPLPVSKIDSRPEDFRAHYHLDVLMHDGLVASMHYLRELMHCKNYFEF